MIDLESLLYEHLPMGSPDRLHYTRRAYRLLPPMAIPRILDVGCGRGEPTLELARLSGGMVIGMDVDHRALEALQRRAREAGLGRIAALEGSLLTAALQPDSFDIIWAEGSLRALGMHRGLAACHRLLRADGHVAVHEAVWLRPDPPVDVLAHWRAVHSGIAAIDETMAEIERCGYETVGHLALPEDAWWRAYYEPLQARVRELRSALGGDAAALARLDKEQRAIDAFRRSQHWYGSAFFVARRRDQPAQSAPAP